MRCSPSLAEFWQQGSFTIMGIRALIPASFTSGWRAVERQPGIRFSSAATQERQHGKRAKTRHPEPAHPTWQKEWFLAVSLGTCLLFLVAGTALDAALHNPAVLALVFIFLFAVILGSAMSVVRHAEHIAVVLGQPYGTLVLTLSVTFVEVASISAVMLHGENNPTLVRDTLIAVVMII